MWSIRLTMCSLLIYINLLSIGYTYYYNDENQTNEYESYEEHDDDKNDLHDIYEKANLYNVFPGLPYNVLDMKVKGQWIKPGQTVGVLDMVKAPFVSWLRYYCPSGSQFTLYLLDVNPLLALKGRQVVLWQVRTSSTDTKSSSPLKYRAPTPPPGTGKHNIVAALYCTGSAGLVGDTLDRSFFYAKDHGTPAAVNFVRIGVLPELEVTSGVEVPKLL